MSDTTFQFVKEFGFPAFLLLIILWRIDKYATQIIYQINNRLDRTIENDSSVLLRILDIEKRQSRLEEGVRDLKKFQGLTHRENDPL